MKQRDLKNISTPASSQPLMLTDWLPTSVKEMKLRGWDEVDVVIFRGMPTLTIPRSVRR